MHIGKGKKDIKSDLSFGQLVRTAADISDLAISIEEILSVLADTYDDCHYTVILESDNKSAFRSTLCNDDDIAFLVMEFHRRNTPAFRERREGFLTSYIPLVFNAVGYGYLIMEGYPDAEVPGEVSAVLSLLVMCYCTRREIGDARRSDALTGLVGIQQLFIDESEYSDATFAICKIDALNTYNQKNGMVVGDELILKTAMYLAKKEENIKKKVYRIGGGSFAILWEGDIHEVYPLFCKAQTEYSDAMGGTATFRAICSPKGKGDFTDVLTACEEQLSVLAANSVGVNGAELLRSEEGQQESILDMLGVSK